MKSKLNIFSNNKTNVFLSTLLSEYELVFSNLDSIDYNLQNINTNIIIINHDKEAPLIDLENLNENNLIISNLKKNYFNNNKSIRLLNSPMSISHIKNKIENFLQNTKVQIHDICIENEKLINIKKNSYCYLTKAEFEILKYLITGKETSKTFIKKNILNIKSSIETNSVESHLTRIRKKLNKVKTNIKIISKNEKLLIKF